MFAYLTSRWDIELAIPLAACRTLIDLMERATARFLELYGKLSEPDAESRRGPLPSGRKQQPARWRMFRPGDPFPGDITTPHAEGAEGGMEHESADLVDTVRYVNDKYCELGSPQQGEISVGVRREGVSIVVDAMYDTQRDFPSPAELVVPLGDCRDLVGLLQRAADRFVQLYGI